MHTQSFKGIKSNVSSIVKNGANVRCNSFENSGRINDDIGKKLQKDMNSDFKYSKMVVNSMYSTLVKPKSAATGRHRSQSGAQ